MDCLPIVPFTPPLPIFDLVHPGAAHLIILVQLNSCLPEQLLPGNWITVKENSCLPEQLLPCNLGTGL